MGIVGEDMNVSHNIKEPEKLMIQPERVKRKTLGMNEYTDNEGLECFEELLKMSAINMIWVNWSDEDEIVRVILRNFFDNLFTGTLAVNYNVLFIVVSWDRLGLQILIISFTSWTSLEFTIF